MGSDTSTAALIVVDLQNDFCPGGALAVPEGDAIVPIVNRISQRFDLVVATQDWHPRHHVSFASEHSGFEPFDVTDIDGNRTVLWPDHCVQGSKGAELHPELDTTPVRMILRKGTDRRLDSYSAFFENDRTTRTGLDAFLRAFEVTTVYLCGLARDVCVYYSATDARRLDYETCLIEDATRGVDTPPGNVEETNSRMRDAGVTFISEGDLSDLV